jgi:lantibiotic transport system permease protein
MVNSFINGLQSEWFKKQKSAASWLTIIGAFFIPCIVLVHRMTNVNMLYDENTSNQLWEILFERSWNMMAIFLLPMGIILVTSLIAQLEYKNNTWKQLHTTPQSFTTIFCTKFSVILIMMLQFFILFNLGVYLSAIIPCLFFKGVPFPKETFPALFYAKNNLFFFIDCLPIIALQYLLSLRFKNFLVSISFGLAAYVAAVISLPWKYVYTIPYTYPMLHYLKMEARSNITINIHLLATGYFILFTIINYILYQTKKEKG